jgi:tRNA modification GTPase
MSSDTITALATPVGTSAIAVVRASGPQVAGLVPAIFGAAPPPRAVQHADYRDAAGCVIDDVLFTFFAAPNSYTGEDLLEISSHGNPFIAQKILEDLVERGCRHAEPGEFTKRAFLNGRIDLSQAEAVLDLIHARSERALAAATQQLRGSLGRHIGLLISRLVNILAETEAYIDFPDEDLPPENRTSAQERVEELITDTSRLLATHHYGELLREGIKTVIFGETNAGKSSLLNRLVGHERALVSPEPGTTRDYLEERILVGPHSLRLIDTAGLNPSPTPIEQRGIGKTLEQMDHANLLLWVIDTTRPLPELPREVRARLTPANTIVVFNKTDLVPPVAQALPQPFPSVRVSALNGTGFDALQAAVTRFADSFQATVGDDVIAINARHATALKDACACLAAAKLKLEINGSDAALLASDLRGALDAFGQIAGKVDNERMLDQLFATFCIGK